MAYVIDRKIHTIDANDRVVGRLATEIVLLLRGKNKADFTPHIDNGDIVVIKNASKMKLTGANKMAQKMYFKHSGHPGRLTAVPLQKVWDKNPGEVLRRAVSKMLPKNKLRSEMIKRLQINL